MTLPQHLEPFLFRENPSLTCALRAVDQEYSTAGDAEGLWLASSSKSLQEGPVKSPISARHRLPKQRSPRPRDFTQRKPAAVGHPAQTPQRPVPLRHLNAKEMTD
ncbi:hypothetical protein Zmor_002477 [Zophobas morio]|uniref:Uncharacterized protein n=1 Tax=Zophobas morio TaxID=2755281 RepID=A0AA38J6H9_9CUCU|nr:hypothetical protein Zmor_002477 [Zophobas morio]